MTNNQPNRNPGYAAQIWWFTLGLLIFGGFGLAMFFAGSAAASAAGAVALAAVMILLTGGAAFWAMRSKKIALGSGILIGYAIATVASGGQCTFLSSSANYGFLGGAIIYVYGIGLALAVGVVASIISAFTGRRGGTQ